MLLCLWKSDVLFRLRKILLETHSCLKPSRPPLPTPSQTSSRLSPPTHNQTSQIISRPSSPMPNQTSSLPPALHSSSLPVLYPAPTCSRILGCSCLSWPPASSPPERPNLRHQPPEWSHLHRWPPGHPPEWYCTSGRPSPILQSCSAHVTSIQAGIQSHSALQPCLLAALQTCSALRSCILVTLQICYAHRTSPQAVRLWSPTPPWSSPWDVCHSSAPRPLGTSPPISPPARHSLISHLLHIPAEILWSLIRSL